MARDLAYEKAHVVFDEQSQEVDGIQCKNYKLCGSVLPKWWWNCNECYLCTNCENEFGELKFQEIDCPICFDYTQGVSQLKCDHMVCIDCFKRCYYGDEDADNEPKFPYPELEEEYAADPVHPKWDHYPFIHVFHEEWNKWDQQRMAKYDKEASLRVCPLCRK
jgi:hypothetical protein